MRATKFWVLFAVAMFGALAPVRADESAIKWVRRLDEAKRIAQAEGKDLLINFTGLSWCGYCKRLEAEVFGKPEFAAAADDFVLVEFDYPGTDEYLEGDMKEWFPKLRDYYMVSGYPTVIVADAKGLPVAYTGYNTGITPEKFLQELSLDRAGRQARDAALAEAAKLTGAERAKKLHEGLQAVALNLGTMYSRKMDPLFAYYGDVVEEIKSLDGDSGETAKYYEKRIATRKAWEKQPGVTIFRELRKFKGVEDAPAAIAYIEQTLPSVQDDDVRWRLELARQTQLELSSWQKDAVPEERTLICEEALANARRLLKVPPPSADLRVRVLSHEAHMLQRLGRVDEMVAIYDGLIADAAENSPRRLARLRRKATSLLGQPDLERTLAAFRDYRDATEPKSEKWLDAIGMTALALERAGKSEQAIEFRMRYLAVDPDSFAQRLALARNQQAAGQLDEARKSLDEAEAGAAAYIKNAKRPDKLRQERFLEAAAQLRKLLDSGR